MRLFLIETWASQDQHIMVACMPPLLLFCFSEEFVSCSNIHICRYFPEHFYWRIFLTEYLNCPNSLHKGQWLGIGDHNETQLQTLRTKYSVLGRRFVFVVWIRLKNLCYVVYFDIFWVRLWWFGKISPIYHFTANLAASQTRSLAVSQPVCCHFRG